MIHFIRPSALWLLLPACLFCWWVWRGRQPLGQWQRVCDPHLLRHLQVDDSAGSKSWFIAGLVVAFTLSILALAGPSWRKQDVPAFDDRAPVVMVLDLSAAMLAQDVKPSRIERAKYKIIDLLKHRRGGQTALLAFTSEPFVVTPLTDDVNTIINMLQPLDPQIMPVQGHDLGRALEKAQSLLTQGGYPSGQILVITSELGGGSALSAAENLTDQGTQLFVLGVGTVAGGPIQDASGQLLKDAGGNVLNATLDEAGLRNLAHEGRGTYVASTTDNRDINRLEVLFSSTTKAKAKKNTVRLWQDEGHWLILLLLPIVLLGFRRGGVYES